MSATASSKRPTLDEHLRITSKAPDDLRHLIMDIAKAGKYVHDAIRSTEYGLAGKTNQFGEDQVKLDIVSEEIIQKHLRESKTVATYISEEQNEIVELHPAAPYSVAYDPLDGSSLVEANFAIGSIFGLYKGKFIIGQKPKDQVGALYLLYGPRTVLVYSTGKGVHEFCLNEVGEFIVVREFLGIADTAKNYSPGNLRAVNDTPEYRAMLNTWLDEELTLRYSGCMVADIHHILSKGQGIFTNIGGSKYPEGKLRLAFECGPFSYLVEQAGGAASDGVQAIVNKKIEKPDQRTAIIIGSKHEVERVCAELKKKKIRN